MSLLTRTVRAEETEVRDSRHKPRRDSTWHSHLYRIAPAVLTAVAAYAVYAAKDLELNTPSDPGPGLWPVIVATVMGVTAALLVFLDIADDYEPWTRKSTLVLAGVAVLATFVVLFQLFGFVPSAVLLLLVWLKVIARESWRLSIASAVLGALALNYIFVTLLGVPFPTGMFIFTLGGS